MIGVKLYRKHLLPPASSWSSVGDCDSGRLARPDVDATPWAVWGRLTLINELFLAHVTDVLAQHQLTFNEYQSLAAIRVSGPSHEASPHEIADYNLLTSGGLTNLLKRMEASGLITRRPAEQDRRGVLVSLTQQGSRRLDAALLAENSFEHAAIAGLNAQEAEILTILLRKLFASLQQIGIRGEDRP